MNILVCISQVPDTTAKIGVASDGKSTNPQGIKFILNPYDEFAIEEGLRIRESFGGTVTALTVGGESAKEILRTALAMGADSAAIIKDETRQDSYIVASGIADVARSMSPDIILFGRQSIDFDSFAIPSMVAELLGWPNISMVSELTIKDHNITAERDVEGGRETVTATLPCIIAAQKGLNDPRYPKLPDIMKAKSKPITEHPQSSAVRRVEVLEMNLPETKRLNKVFGESDQDISEVVRLLHEEAKVI